jgi:hypothetical protein
VLVYAITAISAMGIDFARERGKDRVLYKYIVHEAAHVNESEGRKSG